MELLTQDLPSGFHYPFPSITLKPMFFGQVLEYLENVPKNEIEKFYFDYKLVLQDDQNVDNLLLSDLAFVEFMKKAITISSELKFSTEATCPICGTPIKLEFDISKIKFNQLDELALKGFSVEFSSKIRNVRMPRVNEFMKVFANYRIYKKVSDMRLIKLISLFEDSINFQQIIESDVVNATYKDITILAMLDQVYFNTMKPVVGYCPKCNEGITDKDKMRGTEIGIESLISNLFRDIIQNNKLTDSEVIPGEVR